MQRESAREAHLLCRADSTAREIEIPQVSLTLAESASANINPLRRVAGGLFYKPSSPCRPSRRAEPARGGGGTGLRVRERERCSSREWGRRASEGRGGARARALARSRLRAFPRGLAENVNVRSFVCSSHLSFRSGSWPNVRRQTCSPPGTRKEEEMRETSSSRIVRVRRRKWGKKTLSSAVTACQYPPPLSDPSLKGR